MVKKRRTDEVQKVIKNLLELEIPEIQDVAKQLAERIKRLEEDSGKLQDYISEIEDQAAEGAGTLAELKISDLVKELERALGELRQRSRGVVAGPSAGIEAGEKALGALRRSLGGRASGTEAGAEAEGKAETEEEAEVEGEAEEEARQAGAPEEEPEARKLGVEVETYTTPEGFKFRKFQR